MICYTLLLCKATFKRKKEKTKKENHQIWIDFKPIYRLQKPNNFLKGDPSPNTPAGWLTAPPPDSLAEPILLPLHYACFYQSPYYFPVLPHDIIT